MKKIKETVFLLGADDPEMKMVSEILFKEKGVQDHFIALDETFGYEFSSCKFRITRIEWARISGNRVHPGNAYQADPVTDLEPGDVLVRIECEPRSVPLGVEVVIIDHHRPGDPGFSIGPDRYWEAASIGQLYRLLDLEPTQEAKVMAAFDHSFPAAARGECAGISAEEVIGIKVQSIVNSTKTSAEKVNGRIDHFKTLLSKAPLLSLGEHFVRDLRSEYLGAGYSLDLLSAQIAIVVGGQAALLRHKDREDEPEKISISGCALPETIEEFKRVWAPSQGLVRVYGVPARGYAGGYVS